jgi:branched-chain amino acid transport system ATP-binding protein
MRGASGSRAKTLRALPAPARSKKGLARSFQITSIYSEFSALDNVALRCRRTPAQLPLLAARAPRGGAACPARKILQEVGLGARADMTAANLAHGEQRQLEIAMALATSPRLLLLDEPVAGMGTEESQRMVQLLGTLKGVTTMILVEHDMDAVFSLADRISVLVYGRIIATGAPQEIRANPEVRAAYLGEDS